MMKLTAGNSSHGWFSKQSPISKHPTNTRIYTVVRHLIPSALPNGAEHQRIYRTDLNY
ncbi:hypothetical protein L0128_01390 [candidate division KSB1 bacterium]|nr:hypothetical protein [candidate division KSB1 bacterium]